MRALREEKIADLESIILSMIDHYEPHEDAEDRGSELLSDSLMRCIDFGDESNGTGAGGSELDDLLLMGINSDGQTNDSCEDEVVSTTTTTTTTTTTSSHESLTEEIQATCNNNSNYIEPTDFLPILPKITTTTRQGLADFKTEKSTTSGSVSSRVQRPRRFLVIEMGSGRRLYSCSECPLGFLEAGDLEAHLVACHPELERRHVCRECGKAFGAPRHLWKHRREVHRLAAQVDLHHRCEQCQRGFKLADKLRRHRATVHGLITTGRGGAAAEYSNKYQCDECGKCFNRPDNLTQHRAYRHAGKFRTFECRRCGKKFGKMGSLKRHGADCSRDEKLYLYNAGLRVTQQQQQQLAEATVAV
ncbi:hypothetical protein TKK_0006656 [Trichogramma kaykai]